MTAFMPEQAVQRFLDRMMDQSPQVRRLVIGVSGGLDSTVLLHLLHTLTSRHGRELLAVHVHHGLSPHADHWMAHVTSVCEKWQIPLQVHKVAVERVASVEAAARAARYQAFAASVVEGDALLLAQHEDDQAETLLFRLMRGAGVVGLGAMHEAGMFASPDNPAVPLWRPLLAVARQSLLHYAQEHGLAWVDDESNHDARYARNFLRNDILPALRQHWPAVTQVLAATAGRMQEADALLQEMAAGMAADCIDGRYRLLVPPVLALSAPRQRLLLRFWLQQQSFLLPDEAMLERIRGEVMMAREDAAPLVRWDGCEIRRYRQHLYAMPPLPEVLADWQADWMLAEPLLLPDGRVLSVSLPAGVGLADCHVRFRKGGETLRGHGMTHDLKKLLQASGILPWERERLPLVFSGGELMAVAGTSLRSTLLHEAVRFSLGDVTSQMEK